MKDKMNDIEKIDLLTDLIIFTIAKLQQITGMSQEEVMARIKEESDKSNMLIDEIESQE